MKKLVALLIAAVGGLWAAGHHLPGFWSKVPAEVHAAIPPQALPVLTDYFNYPRSDPAKAADAGKPAGMAGAGQGGQRAGGQGGRGGPGGGGRGPGGPGGAGGAPTPVATAQAQRTNVPLMVESIGTVQAIASVVVRSRVDSQIEAIHFADGATVKEGDLLATLDSRAIRAQIAQAEATQARDRASLDLARITLKRGEDLALNATRQRLDENRTNVSVQEAQFKATSAQIDLLKTQLSYYTIHAPISGKAGLANIKPGNMARSSDGATALTTINQIAPIYVAFSLPQRYFGEIRSAIAGKSAKVEAVPQGGSKAAMGTLVLVENTMDNTTGTVGLRAMFDNADEALWPGQIVDLKVNLRDDPDQVIVPREAVQMSQKGNFVFVVADGTARMRSVKTSRSVGRNIIIAEGLAGSETVIVDGQLLVVDGAKVQPRQATSSVAPADAPGKSL